MDHDKRIAIHLELCDRIFRRMQRDGSWPWKQEPDSPNSEDLIDSTEIDDEI